MPKEVCKDKEIVDHISAKWSLGAPPPQRNMQPDIVYFSLATEVDFCSVNFPDLPLSFADRKSVV